MNISPGNLYYHFKSKEKIVEALFAAFRADIEATLAAPTSAPQTPGHLAVPASRFQIDLAISLHLSRRERSSRPPSSAAEPVPHGARPQAAHGGGDAGGLRAAGGSRLTRVEIPVLAENMTLIASLLAVLRIRHASAPRPTPGAGARRGACHRVGGVSRAAAAPCSTNWPNAIDLREKTHGETEMAGFSACRQSL